MAHISFPRRSSGPGRPRPRTVGPSWLAAGCLVYGACPYTVEVVLGDDGEPGLNLLHGRLTTQRSECLGNTVLTDGGRLLSHQSLDSSCLKVLDLSRTSVETDDAHGTGLTRLPDPGCGSFGRKEVGSEDTGDVGILLQRSSHQLGRRGGIVVAVLHTQVLELRICLRRCFKSGHAGIRRGNTGVYRDNQHLPAIWLQLLDGIECRLASTLVVRGNLRHGERWVIDGRINQNDLDTRVCCRLERALHCRYIGRCHQQCVRLRGHDGIDDRLLERWVELLRSLHRHGRTAGLGSRLDTALHRDVELVPDDPWDKRNLDRTRLGTSRGAR